MGVAPPQAVAVALPQAVVVALPQAVAVALPQAVAVALPQAVAVGRRPAVVRRWRRRRLPQGWNPLPTSSVRPDGPRSCEGTRDT